MHDENGILFDNDIILVQLIPLIIYSQSCFYQSQPFWKQEEVFQLDPLTGEHAPDEPDTIKQHTVNETLLGVIQDVLNGPELSPVLSPIIGNFQVEVLQVLGQLLHILSKIVRQASIVWFPKI